MKVAYQGERGAFSESAARRLLGPEMTVVPCRSFEEMFAAVGAGEADCCITPIENSLSGSIHLAKLRFVACWRRFAQPEITRAPLRSIASSVSDCARRSMPTQGRKLFSSFSR